MSDFVLYYLMLVFCLVSGLGFGFMSGAFSVANILSDSVGPGTVGIQGDSQYFFISSGKKWWI